MKITSLKLSFSLICVYCIVFIGIICFLNIAKWQKDNVIKADAVSYYAYLPATFIYHDLSLSFLNGANCPKGGVMWPIQAPNGKNVIKTTMGMAFFYSPLFLSAHACAKILNMDANGYSPIYLLFIGYTAALYLFLGLLFLRKILLRYFSEKVTVLTIVIITLATNMLCYFTIDTVNAHIVNFFLMNSFLFFTIKWHEHPKIKYLFALGFTLGLLTLTRPTNSLAILIFFFYGIYDFNSLKEKTALFRKEFFTLLLIPFLVCLVFVPQLLYWKMQTDHYLFNSYIGEQFYFLKPHIIKGLLGFRKGWLVYTPIMILFFVGLFFLKNELKKWSFAVPLFFVFITYILFSWWCWWYGGSFGVRAYIDFYGLFALPIAAVLNATLNAKKKLNYYLLLFACSLLLVLNCIQTYQFKRNIIHYDSMTKEKYWAVFLRFGKATDDSDYLLKAPDYAKAMIGEDE